ncbi:(2Fe-2S)-binding protein [Chelatococcus asaccharovorans]|uniref:(2Fe-2S)-binding protein n=1 Tax=Chelatococcus asaccharovorans TaxID=28210 RepID=UPI000D774C52|nr:(2Fe-2S)-binding protein [Chelatococcus asaccharovorans]MBS7707847.1 (2Fe-2S)-binding protein [Chelatococcus asaccharovorans]
MRPLSPSLFQRVAERDRKTVALVVDDIKVTAMVGDTVMTAILLSGSRLRLSEWGDGPRAGFCMMSACQDCWIWTEDGTRLRACSTPASDGMRLRTSVPVLVPDNRND